MTQAAEYGNLDIVKFLHKHRSEGCSGYTMNMAAENSQTDTVIWLHENMEQFNIYDILDYTSNIDTITLNELVSYLKDN